MLLLEALGGFAGGAVDENRLVRAGVLLTRDRRPRFFLFRRCGSSFFSLKSMARVSWSRGPVVPRSRGPAVPRSLGPPALVFSGPFFLSRAKLPNPAPRFYAVQASNTIVRAFRLQLVVTPPSPPGLFSRAHH